MKIKFCLIIFLSIFVSACTSNVSNTVNSPLVLNIAPSNLQLSLLEAEVLNHKSTALSTMCSAHTYNVNIGNDLTQALKKLDIDGNLSAENTDVIIKATTGKSDFKCVVTSPVSGKCQSKVNIKGNIAKIGSASKDFDITKKATAPTVACGGVTKSLKEASSEAILDLVAQINLL